MANINFTIAELICEDPVFTSVTYTGTRFEFDLNWTSQGAYLSNFDNTLNMFLYIECYLPGESTPYFVETVATPPPIPYDGNHFMVNVIDYDPSFSPKNRLVFRLVMTGEATCYTETTYEFPPNTIN